MSKKHQHEAPADGAAETVPTSTIKIQGLIVSVLAPFAEGHVLSAAEATALNQVRAENVRNNAAGLIQKARKEHGLEGTDSPLPEHVEAEVRAKIADYDSAYAFAGRRARQPVDPVQREAEKIAGAQLRAALSAKNIEVKSLAEGKFEELVRALLQKRPDITAEAQRRVDASKAIGAAALEDLGLE